MLLFIWIVLSLGAIMFGLANNGCGGLIAGLGVSAVLGLVFGLWSVISDGVDCAEDYNGTYVGTTECG